MNTANTKTTEGMCMYAIAFDLDTAKLEANHPATGESWKKAYKEIEARLKKHGFERQQESVYYGDKTVDQVICVLAVQDLAKTFSWFKPSVKDIRMLQLVPKDDLVRVI
jgi:virulence-associated protein VapD